MHMIFIYMTHGEKQKAREEVELLREEYPNDVGVILRAAIWPAWIADYERALRSFDRMVRLNPNERVVTSFHRAAYFMYQGRYGRRLAGTRSGRRDGSRPPVNPDVSSARTLLSRRSGCGDAHSRAGARAPSRMDGIRPILATCLSAQGKHELAGKQLTIG